MCTVFGIVALKPVNPTELVQHAALALSDLQHRGHEWVGTAHSDGNLLHFIKRAGQTSAIFDDQETVAAILQDAPQMLTAHTRYSTTGKSTSLNAQPHYVRTRRGAVALASNGDIYDYDAERTRLEAMGCKIRSRNDGELLLYDILRYAGDDISRVPEGIAEMMKHLRAAYSAWVVTEDTLYLFRDPSANRPLYYMTVGPYFVFASEDCALKGILIRRAEDGAQDETIHIMQVMPGEIVTVRLHQGIESFQAVSPRERLACCAFEKVYFGRPDSTVHGERELGSRLCYPVRLHVDNGSYVLEVPEDPTEEIASFRYRLGKALAQEHPANADCVISVPDSGNLAGVGYSVESELPYRIGFVRNPYVTRTFITPGRTTRESHAAIKFRALHTLLRSHSRVVMVDDSVVYSTSSRRLVKMLYAAGAKEVHVRVSCPPVISPCRYGIDMSSKGTLIAQDNTVEEIRQQLGATSLGYLSVEGFRHVLGSQADQHCLACWTGEYRI